MAIIALKQLESEERQERRQSGKRALRSNLHLLMEAEWGAHEDIGVGEKHVRLLPSYPAWEVRPSPC